MNYTCVRVFGVLGPFGETGLKYPNGLGYTESNAKSSTPHLTPNGVFQFGHAHLGRYREIYSWIKICSSKKVEKTCIILINDLFCFVLFVCFFSINFLNLKTDLFFDQSLTCDSASLEVIHQIKSITVIGLIVQNIKLYSGIKATWQLNYTWFIFWAFRQTGKTGKNTPNNLGYTENISKSPTPHSASDKVFRLIFIQPLYAINLTWWSIF